MSKLRVLNKNIESLYRDFFDGKFIVNRRYQRKLVWGIEDKRLLVDSILNEFPLPAILLVEKDNGDVEILDWMQRLNAIFSFIENKYSYDWKYFDVSVSTYAQKNSKQETPSIWEDYSRKFLGYELSTLLISGVKDENEIDTIFKRLNSGWRSLSLQEIRQAWKTSLFAQKVNEIASYIRGDAIIDKRIPLRNMPLVSLNIDESSSEWIDFSNSFFIRNTILNKKNILQSEDEYLVSHLLWYILLDKKIEISSKSSDWLYWINNSYRWSSQERVDEIVRHLESKLSFLGTQNIDIRDNILYIYDNLFKSFFDWSTNNFQSIFDLWTNRAMKEFVIIFLAFYSIVFNKDHSRQKVLKKEITSTKLMARLKLVAPVLDFAKWWTQAVSMTETNVNNAVELLSELFENDTTSSPTNTINYTEIESVINYSKIENSFYDFKLWIVKLDSCKEDPGMFSKLAHTIVAISNSLSKSKDDKNKYGYIFIGLWDSLEQAKSIKKTFWLDYELLTDKPIFWVVNDLNNLSLSLDRYFSYIQGKLKSELLKYSNNIYNDLRIDVLNIKWKECILIKIPSVLNYWKTIHLDNKVPVRNWSSTEDIEDLTAIIQLNSKISWFLQ